MSAIGIRLGIFAAMALGLVVAGSSCASRSAASKTQPEVIYRRQTGDLAAFFLKQACAYGARPKTNAVILKLETTWDFAPDADGFQIELLPADTERLVHAALVPAFGEPLRRPTYPHIFYYIKDIGVRLTINTDEASNLVCWGTTNHHLTCVRGSTMLRELGVKQ